MRVAVSVDTDDLPSWVEKPGSSRPGRRLDRLAVWFFGLDGRRSTSELFELAAHLCKRGLGGLLPGRHGADGGSRDDLEVRSGTGVPTIGVVDGAVRRY